MSPTAVLGVALLGGVGAVARVLLDGALSARFRGPFPLGILAVNLLGALLLGGLVGASASSGVLRLAGTGLIGAFTTFSTWMFDSRRLALEGRRPLAVVNLLVSLTLGLAVVWIGRRIGGAL